jgi:zinc transport system ATP-binding protein
MSLIDVKNLTFDYDKTVIFDGVDLSIDQGEFIGIFGPNGGGKTTLFKLLLGFLKAKKGSIKLFGKQPQDAREKIGYVPQANLFDRKFPISVLEVVLSGMLREATFFGNFTKESKEKAMQALKRVGLADYADRAFGTLSGGQAQRVLIARSLVGNPSLLFLDEPTACVDPDAEKKIYSLLDDLKGELTILMITHDLSALVDRADRLLCVHRSITSYKPKEMCEHFTVGLYHEHAPPKKKRGRKKKDVS